ncbi:MAG: hypothetical protein ACK5GX_05785, partial [Bacteroidota bacterium]
MSLIEKYKINNRDLYIISLIEAKKKRAGFIEKEKLKASALSVLKPYNVKFFDIGILLNEIKKNNYHLSLDNNFSLEEKKEIEDSIQTNNNVKNFYIDWWKSKSKKQKIFYVLIFTATVGFLYGIFSSNSINPDLIIDKKWVGEDSYVALGMSYDAEITLQINKNENGYQYKIKRVVYENGVYVDELNYQGSMNP